jgi:membrane protein
MERQHSQHSQPNAQPGYHRAIDSPSRIRAANDDFGQEENSSATGSGGGWKDILVRLYRDIGKRRILALAAGVTFYSILAIFPAIAALVAVYGLFADPASISTHLDSLSGILPGGAIDVIKDQMTRIALHGKVTLGLTFLISFGLSLWSANAGLKALFDALNLVHGEEEKRGFIELNLVSLTFTILGIVLILFALAAVIAIPVILKFAGLGGLTGVILTFGRWPVLFLLIAFVLALIYRYGPCRPNPKWRWITWGSAVASLAWILLSVLFSWYAANFGSYNETYGSLGAIMGFMVWLWLSTIVVLLGAELDAEMERQTGRDAR